MRKVTAVEFVSLDGVIQAPGGPEEDPSSSFHYGGWLAPFGDKESDEALALTYGAPYDLLLGRKTYDIFADYWPKIYEASKSKKLDEGAVKIATDFHTCAKYVATHSPQSLAWENSQSLGADIAQGLEEVKQTPGRDLLLVGSSVLLHTLLAHDLIDELHLHIAPVILGKGKRLFDETSKPRTLKLSRSVVSANGVLLMNYTRGGEIQVGTVGENP